MESSGIASLGSRVRDENKDMFLDAAVELGMEEMWAVNTAQCNNLALMVESGSEGEARYQAYDSLVMVDRRRLSAPPTDPLLLKQLQFTVIRMRTGSHRGGDHGSLLGQGAAQHGELSP
jgi:hypothetical protein